MDYFDYKGEMQIDNFNTMKDNFGTSYAHSLFMHDYFDECYVTYLLNGNYSTLNLTVAVPYDNRAAEYFGDLKIYADDQLIYSSEKMTSGSAVQPVLLDITGVQQLKLVWGNSNYSYDAGMATAWDAYVQR